VSAERAVRPVLVPRVAGARVAGDFVDVAMRPVLVPVARPVFCAADGAEAKARKSAAARAAVPLRIVWVMASSFVPPAPFARAVRSIRTICRVVAPHNRTRVLDPFIPSAT
jgi:hypothetical protein